MHPPPPAAQEQVDYTNEHNEVSSFNGSQIAIYCMADSFYEKFQAGYSPIIILYSRKFLREKTFTNFVVLEPPAKVFSMKFGRAIPTCVRF